MQSTKDSEKSKKDFGLNEVIDTCNDVANMGKCLILGLIVDQDTYGITTNINSAEDCCQVTEGFQYIFNSQIKKGYPDAFYGIIVNSVLGHISDNKSFFAEILQTIYKQ